LVIFISCRYLLDGLAEKVVGYKDFMLWLNILHTYIHTYTYNTCNKTVCNLL
jgi:hypothetical protein